VCTDNQLIGSCDGGQAVNADIRLGINIEDLLLTVPSCNTTLGVILKKIRIILVYKDQMGQIQTYNEKAVQPSTLKDNGGSKLTLAKGGKNYRRQGHPWSRSHLWPMRMLECHCKALGHETLS